MKKLKIFEKYNKYKNNTKQEIEKVDKKTAQNLLNDIYSYIDNLYCRAKNVVGDEAVEIRDILITLWECEITLEQLEEAILEEKKDLEMAEKLKYKLQDFLIGKIKTSKIKKEISLFFENVENPTYENYFHKLLY